MVIFHFRTHPEATVVLSIIQKLFNIRQKISKCLFYDFPYYLSFVIYSTEDWIQGLLYAKEVLHP